MVVSSELPLKSCCQGDSQQGFHVSFFSSIPNLLLYDGDLKQQCTFPLCCKLLSLSLYSLA